MIIAQTDLFFNILAELTRLRAELGTLKNAVFYKEITAEFLVFRRFFIPAGTPLPAVYSNGAEC